MEKMQNCIIRRKNLKVVKKKFFFVQNAIKNLKKCSK